MIYVCACVNQRNHFYIHKSYDEIVEECQSCVKKVNFKVYFFFNQKIKRMDHIGNKKKEGFLGK